MRICPRCLIEDCVIRPNGQDNAYCSECNKENCREWYKRNKEVKIKKTRRYQISTDYKTEKTDKQKVLRNIKRKTRTKYPIENQKCKFCPEKARERHHYTTPLEIDKFYFVCHQCHLEQDYIKKQKGGKKHNGNKENRNMEKKG